VSQKQVFQTQNEEEMKNLMKTQENLFTTINSQREVLEQLKNYDGYPIESILKIENAFFTLDYQAKFLELLSTELRDGVALPLLVFDKSDFSDIYMYRKDQKVSLKILTGVKNIITNISNVSLEDIQLKSQKSKKHYGANYAINRIFS